MLHIRLLVLSFFILQMHSYAQINNQLLENRYYSNKKNAQQLVLGVNNINFLKNNEYFKKIATGYTLFGSQLYTQLAYIPNASLRIQAGLYMRKDFGNPKFTQIAPLLSIKYRHKNISLLMGTFEANLNHRLIEPLYNTELFITKPIESGIQMQVHKKKYWSDTWIDWEVQQYENSPFKETITAGHNSLITLYNKDTSGFAIKMPLQAIVNHNGGQLDTLTEPLLTIINAAVGISLEKKFKKNRFIKSVKTENYYCIYHDASGTKLQHYNDGSALYFNASVTSKYDAGIQLGYWSGNQFITRRGGYLYQSISSIPDKINYKEQKRELLFIRFLYQKKISNGFHIDVRFEPYYDLKHSFLEYSYSIYFTYKKDFRLSSIKPITTKKTTK